MSPWTFQVGLNVTVDETWVDVTSKHQKCELPRGEYTGEPVTNISFYFIFIDSAGLDF
jgi:hypothetical protein